MEKQNHKIRFIAIGIVLLLILVWSVSMAQDEGADALYPNSRFLVKAETLKEEMDQDDVIIVDVRTDEHYTGKIIPGAIRMKWSDFRHDDVSTGTASLFVGTQRAQEILGKHGIGRTSRVVLYDSVERDGGATASYVFWVLDILGHKKKMVLEGGINAWERAGFELESKPKQLSSILYQAPSDEIKKDKLIHGDFIRTRLGDKFYQIIDVRSPKEYRGDAGTKGLEGEPLKLGHIPTAVNINYVLAWEDEKTKMIRSYKNLQNLYKGLDPDIGVIVYCNSGRRSSFSYFILRLMEIDNVITYEPSWKEWGNPDNFYPVETKVNKFAEGAVPGTSRKRTGTETAQTGQAAKASQGSEPKGGYVSCGG